MSGVSKSVQQPESAKRQPTPAEVLATPVEFVRGVGPQRAELLAKLEVRTAGDLVFFFPRDYQDLTDRREIADLQEDALQTVRGEVVEVDARSSGFGKSVVGVLVRQGHDHLRAIWFNQPFMREKFREGQHVLLSAKPRFRGGRWEMPHPRVTWLDGAEDQPEMRLLPLYPLTEGVTQYQMRRMVASAVENFGHVLEEVFPDALLRRYDLMPLAEALSAIHSPQDAEQLERARRRFVFQELFVLQLAVVARRWQQQVGFRAPPLAASADINARIERLFPFELTAGQRMAMHDVAADMARETPMNRLLQGDVGSGKTVIAVYAMLLCVARGHQAALMAPTEILARQHAETLGGLLRVSRVRYLLLVGGMTAKEREAALAEIAAGRIDLVIGTHALLQEDVQFAKLGLVVIDEQHKFGVRQRATLRQGEKSPHYLVMTATPIPRTISMTLFGDLDVTTLREMPPGRQEVRTYVVQPNEQDRWWHFVREKLRAGRQAYVVAPLVDESENIAAASVSAAFERLTNGELAAFRVGIIHGRMTPAEKEHTMAEFRTGRTHVLVSTSVIEVGVDVPNACIMVIDSPERFGLAQLHQLRGRVGRGKLAAFCGVLASDDASEQARERLSAFAATSDGFELAEMDFQLRGPGDLFGTQQHGLPPLRIADLRRDQAILEEARREAQSLFAADPGLKQSEHTRLRRQMLVRYGNALELGDVG
ncbi:MAG: ATP-dependent DNA helicase RecG [Planctomycetes bacterium]|nr:ATP-dependent DNA helicase RecG [Planctomycetota bacterium]